MLRRTGWLALALLAAAPLLANAQVVCYTAPPAPVVSYYAPPVAYTAPAPVVAYSAPAVSYYARPVVAAYTAPAPVVAYAAPAPVVSYAPAVAPVTVSTYRYGLFGRRSTTVVNYGPAAVYYR
jgi:hypothetical protein